MRVFNPLFCQRILNRIKHVCDTFLFSMKVKKHRWQLQVFRGFKIKISVPQTCLSMICCSLFFSLKVLRFFSNFQLSVQIVQALSTAFSSEESVRESQASRDVRMEAVSHDFAGSKLAHPENAMQWKAAIRFVTAGMLLLLSFPPCASSRMRGKQTWLLHTHLPDGEVTMLWLAVQLQLGFFHFFWERSSLVWGSETDVAFLSFSPSLSPDHFSVCLCTCECRRAGVTGRAV